jgi:U32 family peptidase
LFDIGGEKEIQSNHGPYLISTRDLNTYENLYEIAASKAASLKIEGRMKRPEYVAIITHNYREALDCIQNGENQCISEQAAYELKIAFNREFTQGYMFNRRNQEIVNSERPDNRGIYIGRVLNQKGNIVELLLEDNFLNDGDSIEIVNENGKTAGGTISGIKKDNNTVKSAKAGDKIRIFITDRVVPGSIINKTIDSKLFQKAREEYAFKNKKKITINGIFTGCINNAPTLEVSDYDGNNVIITGDEIIQPARKLAMSVEKIAEQLNKTKDTPYVFEQLDINIEENSFLSVKAINNLRREAIELLSNKRIQLQGRSMKKLAIKEEINRFLGAGIKGEKELIAGVTSLESGISAIKGGADSLYILGDYRYNDGLQLINELSKICNDAKCSLYYVLPQITRDAEAKALENMLQQLERNNELGLVISNLGHLKIAQRLRISKLRSNFTLNIVNSAAAEFLKKQGVQSICISPELNLTQIKELSDAIDIDMEAVVYGYQPAMITEYCPKTSASACNACKSEKGSYGIIDERNKLFRVINMGNCKSMILNSDVLCVYENLSNILDSGISKFRLDFYNEKDSDVLEIVKAYKEKLNNSLDNNKSDIIEELKKTGYTKGHYFRGID